MSSSTYELLARLRENGVSRNRNFELFHSPAARRALRIHRMLRQLEKDLLRHATRGTLRVIRLPGDRVMLELEVPHLKLRRRVFLEEAELALIAQVPEVARLLALGDEGPSSRPSGTLWDKTAGP
jgi:hypothetical protein